MKSRQNNAPAIVAARAGFSSASAYRIEGDPRLPSQKKTPRGRRRPDPLAGAWDSEIVPMLEAAPGIRAVAIFEEICRRHPEVAAGVWRSVASHGGGRSTGPAAMSFSARSTRRAGWVCLISPTCASLPSRVRVSRSITGCTTSGWRSRARELPKLELVIRASEKLPGPRNTSGWVAAALSPTDQSRMIPQETLADPEISQRSSRGTGCGPDLPHGFLNGVKKARPAFSLKCHRGSLDGSWKSFGCGQRVSAWANRSAAHHTLGSIKSI
jgi:hypothetical protein